MTTQHPDGAALTHPTYAGMRDEAVFLGAWRQGVGLAGWHYFGSGGDPAGMVNKWDLCPQVDAVTRAVGWLSHSEALFLAAMVSFYNARVGGELLHQLVGGHIGLADIAAVLDPPHRVVLADLLLSYAGW